MQSKLHKKKPVSRNLLPYARHKPDDFINLYYMYNISSNPIIGKYFLFQTVENYGDISGTCGFSLPYAAFHIPASISICRSSRKVNNSLFSS